MPYRLKPSDKTVVQVKRKGRWVTKKKHPNKRKARAHLTALNMNVKHK